MCPICFSLERHRFLALTLTGLKPVLVTATNLLEAAPQPQVKRTVMRLAPDIRYVATDLMDLRRVDVCADGLALPFRDGTFDVMLHFHVFEHIPDDHGAMREVARVLRPGGLMICQVPYRPGQPTDEDFTLSPEENRVRFGQEDHVRYYGDDFEDRLRASGLTVASYTAGEVLDATDLDRFNIPTHDRLWFCTRTAASGAGVVDNAELDLVRAELAEERSQYERLRSRKVVRAGLAAAQLARPAVTATRRMKRKTTDE